MKRYRNYIDGDWRAGDGGAWAPNRNPARTDDVLGEVPLSSAAQADEAITAAHRALPG